MRVRVWHRAGVGVRIRARVRVALHLRAHDTRDHECASEQVKELAQPQAVGCSVGARVERQVQQQQPRLVRVRVRAGVGVRVRVRVRANHPRRRRCSALARR